MDMAKIGKRLMAVCSVAVTTVYAAGYIYTMPSAQASTNGIPNLSSGGPTQSTPGAAAKAYQTHQPTANQQHKVPHQPGASASHKHKASNSSATTGQSKPKTAAKGTGKAVKKAKAATALYKDGVYTGVGNNAYGSLALSVTIAKGRIAKVVINQYSMHYPQSVIDPQLPEEAVKMQTWKIYLISGATASTYNFAEAMYYALQKAKA